MKEHCKGVDTARSECPERRAQRLRLRRRRTAGAHPHFAHTRLSRSASRARAQTAVSFVNWPHAPGLACLRRQRKTSCQIKIKNLNTTHTLFRRERATDAYDAHPMRPGSAADAPRAAYVWPAPKCSERGVKCQSN